MRVTRHNSCGFTLIELMIALTIGMILVLGLEAIYSSASSTFRQMEALSQIQERGRTVLDHLRTTLLMTGYVGCAANCLNTNIINSTNTAYQLFNQPLTGYGAGQPDPITNGTSLGSDAFMVLAADNSNEAIVADHDPASNTIRTILPHNIAQNTAAVMTDGTISAVLFLTSGVSAQKISYNVGVQNNASIPQFISGSRLYPLKILFYYVRANSFGGMSLYRKNFSNGEWQSADEIMSGVLDMRVTYGVNTSTRKGAVTQYVIATAVQNWSQVVSMRLSLLMVSDNASQVNTAPQTYTYNGATVTAPDLRLYKVFNLNVALRSRQ